MTMTGRLMADEISSEFLPDVSALPWAHEYGAIDASPLIPAGSTKAQCVGQRGFGRPRTAARERME